MTGTARFAVLATLLLNACARTQAQAPPPPAPAPEAGASAVVAEFKGATITRTEIEQSVALELTPVRQQEYDILRRRLDRVLFERLASDEAKARGITTEALIDAEVQAKAKVPTTQDAEQWYEKNKARVSNQPKDQVIGQITEMLRQQNTRQRDAAFRRELYQKAGVKIALQPPRYQVEIPKEAPASGPATAPITIVEFTDYGCPYCHRAEDTIEKVLSEYAGKVRFVHRDFPLGNPITFDAARAARCAGDQGKFWEYHRGLMGQPSGMDKGDLGRRAASLRLDAAAFSQCLASGRHDDAINRAREQGSLLGVNGTPAYFINGRMLTGAMPIETFREIIESELPS